MLTVEYDYWIAGRSTSWAKWSCQMGPGRCQNVAPPRGTDAAPLSWEEIKVAKSLVGHLRHEGIVALPLRNCMRTFELQEEFVWRLVQADVARGQYGLKTQRFKVCLYEGCYWIWAPWPRTRAEGCPDFKRPEGWATGPRAEWGGRTYKPRSQYTEQEKKLDNAYREEKRSHRWASQRERLAQSKSIFGGGRQTPGYVQSNPWDRSQRHRQSWAPQAWKGAGRYQEQGDYRVREAGGAEHGWREGPEPQRGVAAVERVQEIAPPQGQREDAGRGGQQEQMGCGEQQRQKDGESEQPGNAPCDGLAVGAQPPATKSEEGPDQGLPLRPPPGPRAGQEEEINDMDDLPHFSSDESVQRGGQDPDDVVQHVVYRIVEGAIQAIASDVPLTWDEQGRLDAEGVGAMASEDVPYVLLARYGRGAMYFGPRQPAEGQGALGQTGGASDHGAGSGTFDWDLLPSPAGSRADE